MRFQYWATVPKSYLSLWKVDKLHRIWKCTFNLHFATFQITCHSLQISLSLLSPASYQSARAGLFYFRERMRILHGPTYLFKSRWKQPRDTSPSIYCRSQFHISLMIACMSRVSSCFLMSSQTRIPEDLTLINIIYQRTWSNFFFSRRREKPTKETFAKKLEIFESWIFLGLPRVLRSFRRGFFYFIRKKKKIKKRTNPYRTCLILGTWFFSTFSWACHFPRPWIFQTQD